MSTPIKYLFPIIYGITASVGCKPLPKDASTLQATNPQSIAGTLLFDPGHLEPCPGVDDFCLQTRAQDSGEPTRENYEPLRRLALGLLAFKPYTQKRRKAREQLGCWGFPYTAWYDDEVQTRTANPITQDDPWLGKGTSALIAAGPHGIVISFEGTEIDDLNDSVTDFRISLTQVRNTRVQLHKGFLEAYQRRTSSQSVQGWLRFMLAQIVEKTRLPINRPSVEDPCGGRGYPKITGEDFRVGSRVSIVGHSLGGALGHVAAFDLFGPGLDERPAPPKTAWSRLSLERLASFGSPRAGNRAFQEALRTVPKTVFRAISRDDLVPRVPPAIGYQHLGEAFVYTPTQNDGPLSCTLEVEPPSDAPAIERWQLAPRVFGGQKALAAHSSTTYLNCLYLSATGPLHLPPTDP